MRRRTRKELPKIIGAGIGLMGCIGVLGSIAWQSMGKVVADEIGCFQEAPQAQTVVIVDASEPRWDTEQGRSLRTYFEQAYERLRFNERLDVFTTEGDAIASVVKPRFSVCGQATYPDELASIGAEEAQSGYLARQKERLYNNTLLPELESMLSASVDQARRQANESPIFETIRSVTRAADLQPGDRLVVVSDFIQNSETARFCSVQGAMPAFNTFRQNSFYEDRLSPPSLEGVEVEALMLLRSTYGHFCAGETEVRQFWRDFFAHESVERTEFIRLRTGADD